MIINSESTTTIWQLTPQKSGFKKEVPQWLNFRDAIDGIYSFIHIHLIFNLMVLTVYHCSESGSLLTESPALLTLPHSPVVAHALLVT